MKLNLYFSSKYGDLIQSALSALPNATPGYQQVSQDIENFKKVWSQDKIEDRFVVGRLPPLLKRIFWPSEFQYFTNGSVDIRSTRLDDVDNGLVSRAFTLKQSSNTESHEFPAPFMRMLVLVISVFLSTAFKKKVFSDVMAPLLFAAVAICCLVESVWCSIQT